MILKNIYQTIFWVNTKHILLGNRIGLRAYNYNGYCRFISGGGAGISFENGGQINTTSEEGVDDLHNG